MVDAVSCPNCKSEQISSHKQGWTFGTGMINSGRIWLTCINCGYRFRPGLGKDIDTSRWSSKDREAWLAKRAPEQAYGNEKVGSGPAISISEKLEQLEKLKNLLDSGVLTEEEFAKLKSNLI